LYVFSWFNPFGIAVGIFTIVICGYLASIYSLREVDSKKDLKQMLKKTRDMMLAVFVAGGLVFLVAYFSGIPLIEWVFTGSLGILLWCINNNFLLPVRTLGAFQIIMIMAAATYRHIPNIIVLGNGKTISLIENAAPESTLTILGWALLIGCIFILPFLFYLMFSFTKAKK
jgi:cytochrome d ubiquinol oxidase subunit II